MEEIGHHAVAQFWNGLKCGSLGLLCLGSQGDEQRRNACQSERIVHRNLGVATFPFIVGPAQRAPASPYAAHFPSHSTRVRPLISKGLFFSGFPHSSVSAAL